MALTKVLRNGDVVDIGGNRVTVVKHDERRVVVSIDAPIDVDINTEYKRDKGAVDGQQLSPEDQHKNWRK